MNEFYAYLLIIYLVTILASFFLYDVFNKELYNFETKEDILYSILKILFAPVVFIPWGIYGTLKWTIQAWADKPDTRKDL